MLAVEAPISDCCNANAFRFWHLPISKAFEKPKYYLGQTVLHLIKVRQGEILHPVTVIGLWWTGVDWMYFVEFPEDHPQFKHEDNEFAEVAEWQIEPM